MKFKNTTTSSIVQEQLVDITGLCNPQDVTAVIGQYPYWKQMYIPECLPVPCQKPNIEEITSVDIAVDILRSEVIMTPISFTTDTIPTPVPNYEGKLLTGRKLIIEGQLCQKIEYTAADTVQSIHSAHFYVPFSSYIIVPQEITFTSADGVTVTLDSLDVNYQVNTCVEDVVVYSPTPRMIAKQVTLLLYAVPTRGC